MNSRAVLAIISNSCPPYRLHLHRRINAEIPEIQLFTLFTHQDPHWEFRTAPEISPVMFGAGETVLQQAKLSGALREWTKAGNIIRWLKENNARAVVIGGYNDLGRLRIIWWCHRNRVPCMLVADSNIRGDEVTGLRAWAKRQFVSRVIRKCEVLLVCGRLGKEYFLKYGADPKQIFYSPYEPDYSMVRNISDAQRDAAAAKFGLNPNRRKLVYTGRLVGVKRVDLLIDAFSKIAGQIPDWDLLIVGDGPLRKDLESRVPNNLAGRIIWTGFLDDQPLVSALYRASDVLVLPSDNEPWAVVINEAVAAGMAIVASDVVGAAAELVRDGVNGRIFRRGDLNHLTECLIDVTDPAHTDAYKTASATVLSDWQRNGDPVNGLRNALKFVRAI